MDHSPPPISAYLTMLAAADITDRADIQAQLLEEDSNGASVLSMALANGHDSAFPDLMQCIQYAQFSVDNMQLLLTGGTRRTCLRMLKHASPKAVQAYLDLVRTLISDFNDEDKNKVLKAVNDCANAIKLDPTFIDGKFDLKIDGLIASIKGISLDLQILQNFEIACKSKSLDAATKIIENIQLQPELFNIKITEEICTRFDRNDQCKLFCKIYKHIIRLSEIESDADRAKLFVSFLNSTKSLHPDDRHGLISAIVSNLDHYQPGKAITAEMDGLLDVIENFAGIQDEPKILKKMAHDISRSNHPVTIAEKILNLAGQLLDAERVAVIKAVARSGYYLKFDSKEMLRQKLKLAVESLTTEKQSEILAALDSHMD
ncbi:hypothetical protein AWB78_08438 [Caballeronia calidae]|uniref:Uncharacterized protein n=2 Tax=Caballeronia calidae TaxID=1777139 RepID=A0A158EK92_9BURK|nr:hypothetical protein AWB78_08438 [Caballeronia calidae]